ncbi:MAG: nitronate monooxygenase [Proteobacteria bacterium]|nr:nitronate monooxygenase [Pseudomonadota bacterium]MBU1449540.1 nitronate monooxygenase [Pseudomonadota bacterium]MBU2467431.1 nitronate monooxygenase [Pseudomonadota bacterium]MBU2518109.1 nitronate monooxygenase [Pseudomonadota bacterium]
MLSTDLTKRLGIEHPIQCGTMQWLSRAELVGPAAEAGALACLASAITPDPVALREEIDKTRSITGRPFGVNVSLFPSLEASDIGRLIQTVAECGVGILETAGRSPEPYRDQIKEAGLFHIHKCARMRDAVKAQTLGVDAISVVGAECGGHPGETGQGSLVLIPQIVDTVSRPVIAGGGFCDGRGLAAGLALGAQCINMGTRFILTQECPAHGKLKEFYLKSSADDTMLIMGSLKNTGRVLRTTWTEEIDRLEKEGAGLEKLAPFISGQLARHGWTEGIVDKGIYYAGQVVGRCNDLPSVRELVARIVAEAQKAISRLTGT